MLFLGREDLPVKLSEKESGWVLLRVAGICRPDQRAAQDEEVWRRSDAGDCRDILEVAERLTAIDHGRAPV